MEVNMSASSRQPTGFLDLPLEIRREIYRYCLVRSNPVRVYNRFRSCGRDSRDKKRSLLLVSKEVGIEALDVLYGDTVFEVSLDGGAGEHLQEGITEANRRRIRVIQFLIQPLGIDYDRMLDSTIFPPLLANLKKLSIVAQHDASTDVEDEAEWIEWLEATLEFITCHLPDRCVVEVDDDDEMETSAVMREYFPRGYRKVQTLEGDFWFKRNDYSIESGFWDDYYDDYND